MQNIEAYEKFYISDDEGFEKYQVRYRRNVLLNLFEKYEHKSVLEIGCGMEPLFSFLDLTDIESYTVVEPVKHFCEHARGMRNGEKVKIFNQYMEDFSGGGEYDLIICSSLLHEVDDQNLLLNQIRKVCSKKTIVHINVPNALSFHRLLAKEMHLIEDVHEFSNRDNMRQHTKVFDQIQLEEMLNDHGFEKIKSGSFFVKPFTHDQMMLCVNARIITEEMLEGLNAMTKYMPEYGSDIYCNVKVKQESEGI